MNGFQIKQVKRGLEQKERLTDWEISFFESLSESDDEEMTDKQNEIINRISNKLK